MVKRKKHKTEEEEVIEFLKLNGFVEVKAEDLKNDPSMQRTIEDFRKRYQEHLKWKKSKKKEAVYA